MLLGTFVGPLFPLFFWVFSRLGQAGLVQLFRWHLAATARYLLLRSSIFLISKEKNSVAQPNQPTHPTAHRALRRQKTPATAAIRRQLIKLLNERTRACRSEPAFGWRGIS